MTHWDINCIGSAIWEPAVKENAFGSNEVVDFMIFQMDPEPNS
jgi:hypothetical protein